MTKEEHHLRDRLNFGKQKHRNPIEPAFYDGPYEFPLAAYLIGFVTGAIAVFAIWMINRGPM